MTSGFTSPSSCFVHSHLDSTLAAAAAVGPRRDPRIRSPLLPHPPPAAPHDPRSRTLLTQPPNHVTLQDLMSPSRDSPLHSPSFLPPFLPYSPNTPRAAEHTSLLIRPSGPFPAPPKCDADEDEDEGEETEGEEPESITRQLAQTATSVREMSKQLARARIKGCVQSILIITKARDNHLIKLTRELAIWLMQCRSGQPSPPALSDEKPLVVYVDQQLRRSKRFDVSGLKADHPEFFRPLKPRHPFQRRFSRANSMSSNSSAASTASSTSPHSGDEDLAAWEDCQGQLRYWNAEMCSKSPELFDFVITLGGDGTVLFASWLFQRVVPPIIPFALGSLGFLTNFDYSHYPSVLTQAMLNGVRVNLRMRFKCTVFRATRRIEGSTRAIKLAKTGQILMERIGQEGWEALENGEERMERKQRGVPSPTSSAKMGTGPGSQQRRGRKKAKDKEIMCCTTRPEESFEVLNELVVDRGPSPYVSLLELFEGDHIKVTASAYPFPTVCADNQSTDWFHAISRTLKWNERERQKSFVVVEEEAQGKKNAVEVGGYDEGQAGKKSSVIASSAGRAGKVDSVIAAGANQVKIAKALADVWEEDEEDDENDEEDEEDENDEDDEEEEETFDIDDLSTGTPVDSHTAPTSPNPSTHNSRRPSFKAMISEPLLTDHQRTRSQLDQAIKHQQGLIRRLSSHGNGTNDEVDTKSASTLRAGVIKGSSQDRSPTNLGTGRKSAVGLGQRPSMVSLKNPGSIAAVGPRTFAVWGQDQSSDASSSSDFE